MYGRTYMYLSSSEFTQSCACTVEAPSTRRQRALSDDDDEIDVPVVMDTKPNVTSRNLSKIFENRQGVPNVL